MAEKDLVIRALLQDQFRKERIPVGLPAADFRRKVHQWCKDLGLQPEAVGEVVLPIIEEMIEETRSTLRAAFKS